MADDALTVATALTLDTPAQSTPGATITLTGTYQGNPQALDYNFGAGWVTATTATFSNGIYSITVPAGQGVGSYTPSVRDHNDPTITGTAGTFVVSPWTPSTLATSPGAVAIFAFNANDPASETILPNGTVYSVANELDINQWLMAETGTAGNGIVIANGSGADGTRRLLQMRATTINASIYDPSTNWLGAGGVNGTAGSPLVDLANSSNLSTSGSFTAIIALDINKTYDYAAGPIWGSLASPGPLQYAQIRYNGASGEAGAQVYDSTTVGASAQSTITAGWHVMTMIKDGGTIIYRLDGVQIATVQVTSTLSFTANDFMIGGGFPPATSASAGVENGVPPSYIGDFQAYSGVLRSTDLADAEKLAGNSVGLSLHPTVVTPTIAVADMTTSVASVVAGTLYTGPVTALDDEYINITSDNLNVSASTPNWFIHTGSGSDAVALQSGANVVDAGTNSNFLTSGSGPDTFFVDARGETAPIWTTVANFHAGDAVTFWGLSPGLFDLDWDDGQGATGYTGLTLHATAAGVPTVSLTLAGLTSTDLTNGKLSETFGTDTASGSPYMYITALT